MLWYNPIQPYIMKKIFCLILLSSLIYPVIAQYNHKKLTRAESFWGLHFDKHAEINDAHLGATLTEAMVDSMLRLARPDFIEVDCKGHPGISSYPTEVGQQAASYDKDPLALFRKVTEEHQVALYVHYSGVWDFNYAKNHPEDARIKPDGTPDDHNISFWGNYPDKLLIPQLKEIALKYKVDGAWIDGECWAVEPDYRPEALKEFTRETGITKIPRSPDDPNYKLFLEFNRKKFLSYIDYYTKKAHQAAPQFQICSNWAFSAMVPEKMPKDMQLDFLSGDYDPDDALNIANWHSRGLACQGQPFDLFAWSFIRQFVPKTALQLCQEAASVISLGGGCSVYFRQNKDMSLQPASFSIMKEVADFMIPRREFCHGVKPLPQVGLFYSTAGWKDQVDVVYRTSGIDGIRGILNALLDGQQAVDLLMTHHMEEKMNDYPVIVVPEWKTIEPDIIARLHEYVRNGGNLLVIGADATTLFDDLLGVKISDKSAAQSLGYDQRFVDIHNPYRVVECQPATQEFARLYTTNDFRFPAGVAATIRNYGKGKVAGVYMDMGSSYLSTTSPVFRDFLSGIIAELFPDPLVKISGSHRVNVVPTSKDGRLLVQLINTSGDHANKNVKGIDDIPTLTNLKVSVKTGKKPRKVLLQPDGRSLKFAYSDGRTTFVIPELKIHHIVEIVN